MEVRILKKLKGSGWQIKTGAKPGTRDSRGCSSIYTGKDSRKYTMCQLLYWYRSNEMWKKRVRAGRRQPRQRIECTSPKLYFCQGFGSPSRDMSTLLISEGL
jgi:hypothetical protein